jgi:IS30 family transposase
LDERVEIEKGVDGGESLAMIARRLGRPTSTVSREVKRNGWRPSNTSAAYRPEKLLWCRQSGLTDVEYRASLAQSRSTARGGNSHRPRVFRDDAMVTYVIRKLEAGWSPEMIAGRAGAGFPDAAVGPVCHETIYQWIHSPAQKHRRLWECLPRGHKRRRQRPGRRVHSSKIPFRVSIRHRPPEVGDRSEFGHWEGDTVLGLKLVGDGIHTEVERASRFLVARKIAHVRSTDVADAQHEVFAPMPALAARSVTLDNGAEHHLHHRLDELAMPVYFADPYCSWQRGTNENRNGILRRYLPKGTDFTGLAQHDLDDIVNEINNQPLKILGWATPAEVFHQLCLDPHAIVALQN